MRRLTFPGALLALAALLIVVPGASAAQRWASATSSATSGTCTALAPCRLDYAVEGAASGDEVVVAAGTYMLDRGLTIGAAIVVRGEGRPYITGSRSWETTLSVEAGATVRHLALEATGGDADALTIKDGALVEDVVATSAAGDGAKVVGDPGVTVLRDSVVVTGASAAALKLRDGSSGGDVAIRNVTAYAVVGSGIGVRCETTVGRSTIVNSIIRGASADVDASRSGAADGDGEGACSATHSHLRTGASPGLSAGAGISGAAPLLRDPAAGDFRPLPGSPTIDAGSSDPLLGPADPDGHRRTLGAAPDTGAFEYAPPAAGTQAPPGDGVAAAPEPPPTAADPSAAGPTELPPLPPGVDPPVLGRSVVLAPRRGTVLVRPPGARRYVRLGAVGDLPLGTIIDARRGAVRLSTALDAGHQTATFHGGRFEVRQPRSGRGLTDLVLRGGDFSRCRTRAAAPLARAAAKRRAKAIRRLWGRDRGGRFRTRGRTSVATVRGTAWLTEDRCEGTLTRVTEGAVHVRDVQRGGKARLVRAGRRLLVAKRRR